MKLVVDISRQDYADFNKFHFLKTKLKRTVVIGVLSLIILQLLISDEQFDLTATVIYSAIYTLVYAFAINRSLNRTKSIPDNNGTILGQREMEFTEDKIIYKTANSEGSSTWETIKKMEESSKAFYLYMDTNMAILVPKRFFKDKLEEETFSILVKQKINTP